MSLPDEMGDVARQQLIELLDGRLERADAAERARILAAVTRLYLVYTRRVDQPTVSLFDQIFCRLVDGLPAPPLAALSEALATVGNPPRMIVKFLAHHSSSDVAAAILTASPFLTLADLATVASGGSQNHLLAVCERQCIDERLSAILVSRAMQPVINKLLVNPGAQFALDDFRAALPRATADSRGRVPLRQPALILDASELPAGRCMTLDISPGGLKLQVGPGAPLPETFTIELSLVEHTRLRCRIAWRQLSLVGIQFTLPLADQLLPNADRH